MSARSAVRLASAALLICLAGCSGRVGPAPGGAASSAPSSEYQTHRYRVPRALDDGWATASLNLAGMDRRHIEQMTEAIRRYTDWNIHAVLIERDGQQRIYVLPALRLVVTTLAGRYNDPSAARLTERLLLEHIIPAVHMAGDARSTPEPTSCRAPFSTS